MEDTETRKGCYGSPSFTAAIIDSTLWDSRGAAEHGSDTEGMAPTQLIITSNTLHKMQV